MTTQMHELQPESPQLPHDEAGPLDYEAAWDTAHVEQQARAVHQAAKEKLLADMPEASPEEAEMKLGYVALLNREENEIGNATANRHLQQRELTEKRWESVNGQIELLENESKGVVRIESDLDNPDASLDVAAQLYERLGRKAKPFRARSLNDIKDFSFDDVRTITELSYWTEDKNTVIVEHWSGSTGELLQTTVVKTENDPVKKRHSDHPSLTREAKKLLNPTRTPEQSWGASRAFEIEEQIEGTPSQRLDFETVTSRFRDNLKRLGMSEDDAKRHQSREMTMREIKDANKTSQKPYNENLSDAVRDLGESVRDLVRSLRGKEPLTASPEQTHTARRERQRQLAAEHILSEEDKLLQRVMEQYTLTTQEKEILFDTQDEGVVSVKADPKEPEAIIPEARELYEHLQREPVPFNEKKYHRAIGTGVEIKELWYKTATPEVVVVERWNNYNGSLLETLAVKCDEPIESDKKRRPTLSNQAHDALDWTGNALTQGYYRQAYEELEINRFRPHFSPEKMRHTLVELGMPPEAARRYAEVSHWLEKIEEEAA